MTNIPTVADLQAQGKAPEILFWVGCACSYDDRAQKISTAFAKILTHLNINFAILGTEESCTGDPARRAGNEFLFQMQAMNNIQVLNGYSIKKIVTTCPHCFNIIKNEYPQLGGNYDVVHHTQLLQGLIDEGKIKLTDTEEFKGKKITYHDPCYLARVNGIYEAPRAVLEELDADLAEMKRCKKNTFCCGAGGAQMFKEEEPGKKRVNQERIDEAINTGANVVATGCPFCMTMMTDGVKERELQKDVQVLDIAELLAEANGLNKKEDKPDEQF